MLGRIRKRKEYSRERKRERAGRRRKGKVVRERIRESAGYEKEGEGCKRENKGKCWVGEGRERSIQKRE